MAELFGFKIERLKEPSTDPRQNIVPPQAEDGTQTAPAGGFFCVLWRFRCYGTKRIRFNKKI